MTSCYMVSVISGDDTSSSYLPIRRLVGHRIRPGVRSGPCFGRVFYLPFIGFNRFWSMDFSQARHHQGNFGNLNLVIIMGLAYNNSHRGPVGGGPGPWWCPWWCGWSWWSYQDHLVLWWLGRGFFGLVRVGNPSLPRLVWEGFLLEPFGTG